MVNMSASQFNPRGENPPPTGRGTWGICLKRRSCSSAGQHHGGGDRAASRRGDGHLGSPGELAVTGLAPQLQARLMQQPVAVHAARGQLAP